MLKIKKMSMVMFLMGGTILGLAGCESTLSANASGLETDVLNNLNMAYGDDWEDLLEECYGRDWKSQVEAKYSTSINDCVMMEVERLERLDEIDDTIEAQLDALYGSDWEDCLDQMYGDDWDDVLESKYGTDFDDYLESELMSYLGKSGTLESGDLDNLDDNNDYDDNDYYEDNDYDDNDYDDCDDLNEVVNRCH